jgi:hypothetical protein
VDFMKDRVHRVLDGELPPDALSDDERARADALDRTLGRTTAHLRSVPAPDLAARVMASLPAERPRRSAWRAAAGWLWNPRPIRLTLRPAYALGGGLCAAALAAVALPALEREAAPEPAASVAVAAPSAQPVVYVQFRLQASARRVSLAGSFTGWRPTLALQQTTPGVWTALVPLRPGVHDYVFVVDGTRWIPDPDAPQQVDDSFGGTNSRISLPPVNPAA